MQKKCGHNHANAANQKMHAFPHLPIRICGYNGQLHVLKETIYNLLAVRQLYMHLHTIICIFERSVSQSYPYVCTAI